jgi:CHAT domain-containing protein/tetratricopeptide (TPR) repeat protein
MVLPLLLLIAPVALQDTGSLPAVPVGSVVRGEVAPGAEVLRTGWLMQHDLPTHGQRYRLQVDTSGPHALELRSDWFNAYLVLRDEAGRVIAEDDDGLVWYHARIQAELDAGAAYVLEVGAQDARHGPFELVARAEPFRAPRAKDWGPGDLREGDRWVAAFVEREGIDSLLFAFATNDLGQRHWTSGNFARARDLFEQSIASRELLVEPNDPLLGHPLNNLALAYKRLDDFDGARRALERALAIKEAAPDEERDERSIATSLHNLGSVLINQGDYEQARELLTRALEAREELLGDDPLTASTLQSLSLTYDRLGDPERALVLLRRAFEINEAQLGAEDPQLAGTLNNLAELERHQGDYASATTHHLRALDIFERAHGPGHPDTATSLNNIGTMYRVKGDLDTARPYMERARDVSLAVLGPEHTDTIRSTGNLAMLYGDLGELRAAWELVRVAQLGNLAHARRVLATSSESEGYSFLAMLRWQLEFLLNLAPQLAEPEASVEAYEAVLAWKGRLSRLMLAGRESLRARLSPEQRRLLEDLRASQAELSRLARSGEAADEARAKTLRGERNRLEVELQRTLDGIVPESEADFASVRASLPEHSALIDFFVHRAYRFAREEGGELLPGGWVEEHLYAWIVRPDTPLPVRVDLGPAPELEDAVHEFLEALAPYRGNPIEAQDHRANWLQLGARLWDPLAPHLADCERVFVSPDGFLGKLPFETLPAGDDEFLIEQVAFVYLQDASALEQPTAREGFASLLVMGAVDFNKAAAASEAPGGAGAFRGHSGDFWPRIPATEFEAQLVHDLHEAAFEDGRRLLLRGEAPDENRLKRELDGYTVLHLATHGFFQPEEGVSIFDMAVAHTRDDLRGAAAPARLSGVHPGLLSGLVCAGANRPERLAVDDGYLTAEEVAWLDLTGTELVVLSACETGLGARRSGEGMIGLRRAFHTAGAGTVISSLWSVRDEKTAALMGDFYRNLWLGRMGLHDALRAAQLKMLAESRRENRGHGEPSTWGAFVLSGDWR